MAEIWGDPLTDTASRFETRVCLRLAEETPRNWIIIPGSNQSYTGKNDTLEIDLLLFTDRNCFVIEVKGGDIRAITDEKWVVSYQGRPPTENRLFQKANRSKNILLSKLKEGNYRLNRLPVVPIICCYDDVLERLQYPLRIRDKGNRGMVVGFNQLLDKIKKDEKDSKFKTDLPPAEMAETVYSRYQFKVPEISFEKLRIFQKAHEFQDKGKGEEYADSIYRDLGPYFRYITSKIVESTLKKISKTHGETIELYAYLIEKAKLPGRPYAFFPFVRYPEVAYLDYAQLAFDLGYFDKEQVGRLDIKEILSPPCYAINVKAAVYKAHRADRSTAQKNLEKHFGDFISLWRQIEKEGPQYGFLHHESEDPESITCWTLNRVEAEADSFVKDIVDPYSKAIGLVGFRSLEKGWVEKSSNLIEFVSEEFCRLYPVYKFFFEEL